MRSLARGLRHDLDAVTAGLTLNWNSGGIEGNVNRIKRIKRDGYGRAGIDLLQEALEALGGLDILVNNAGTCFHNRSWNVTDSEWSQVFDLNVRALWKCSIAAGPHMVAAGGGSIVNIGSISGLIVNRPQWHPAYNASKAGGRAPPHQVARWGVGPVRVSVNAVAPGNVKPELAPLDRPDLRRYWIEDTPQQRYAMPRRSRRPWCS